MRARVLRRSPAVAEHVCAPPRSAHQAEASARARLGLLKTSRDEASISSTMLEVKVDRSEALGLHEQVAAELRRAIAEGEAGPGDRLPPARDLAAVLGVNANTVLRALRVLRDEGLLEFRRGRGVTVTGIGPQRSAVVAKARELVALARRYGYQP